MVKLIMRRFLLCLLLFGCDSDRERTTVDSSFREQAEALTRDFEQKLKGELVAAMKEGGPVNAIEVCSKRANEIAKELSNERLVVRRVGTRLRNPSNRPDAYDKRALASLSATAPTLHLQEPKRYYRAIVTKPLCLSCHGDESALAPGVPQTLAKLYPQDEATGYHAGDLRGAFVVQAR